MAAVLLLAALCLLPGSGALTMGGISVPALKIRGDVAHLRCGYQEHDAEGAGAINVTWFKDGVQFYHAVNQGLNVDITLSDVPGVEVDKEDSGFRSLTLKSVKVNTAGKYHCVASSAKNSVTSQEQSMLVIAPPTSDPVISGFREAIWVANGTLEINCTAGKSFPAANITWSVDGKPALTPGFGQCHRLNDQHNCWLPGRDGVLEL
ncbi:Hemicentin-2 [Amphibalanus amphitrite]|uniref:Hemicentin-2 n=1 Tax=Amphibalanus amphitrite TaxID=1232801 RepID=A0A6A4VR64_AMPAM|nr:Hemicentin-2 [Amphibalanus amphitrite]